MPEYLYPGVYLEETAAGMNAIDGVPTPAGDAALKSISEEFVRTMRTHAPGWTDVAGSDPGISILEVFAFLAEGLLYREGGKPERRRSAARVARALAAAGSADPDAGCRGLTRPVYFSGRLLDAATLEQEQEYQREKRRLHNREVLGSGIVSGLAVRVEPTGSGGSRAVVEPGYAIDSRGEGIALPRRVVLKLPASGASTYVTIRFWERVCASTPSGASAVEEVCVVGRASSVAAPSLGLARLLRSEGAWKVDPTFAPPEVGRPA